MPLQKISHPIIEDQKVKFYLKREDLLHPYISGNKIRKLKYNLQQAKLENKEILLTFGGAYSNHIFALAAAGKEGGFKTIGVIRGEAYHPLNPTLQFAVDQGMQLHFLTRQQYHLKDDPQILQQLQAIYGDYYLVPEGGSNRFAIPGCAEIWEDLHEEFNFISTPVGTGGTLAGLLAGKPANVNLLGFPVLKNGEYLVAKIENLLQESGYIPTKLRPHWQLIHDYHFGGYAKFSKQLIDFINAFKVEQGVSLDPVYTGKMMFGLFDLIREGYFPKGSKILALHTGGLQGIAGFNQRFGHLIH
ncbi:MAG: 1-aminocyclopropane-1-carboxylate deaminase/D-cysteine desulfhydrase [Cyclobacteriaceae bacterium]